MFSVMQDREQALLKEIEEFTARHEMTMSRFGTHAVSDPNLVKQIRAGRNVSSRTLAKIQDFMRRHRAKAAAE